MLPQLARAVGAAAVYAHAEVTAEERAVERRVSDALDAAGAPFRTLWSSTLHHPDDMPFHVADMPTNYGAFRAAVAGTPVRAALPAPPAMRRLPLACPEVGDLPTLEQLGVPPLPKPEASTTGTSLADMPGGETEALRRLAAFAKRGANHGGAAAQPARAASGGQNPAASEGMYGANFSCKISPWLALGCISPRRMYEELRAAHGVTGATGAVTVSAVGGASVVRAPTTAASTASAANNNLNWLVFEVRPLFN